MTTQLQLINIIIIIIIIIIINPLGHSWSVTGLIYLYLGLKLKRCYYLS